MWVYKKGDIEAIDEMGTSEKKEPPLVLFIKAQL